MRLTSLADYAAVMMAAAARYPVGARLTATLLADETGVPLPTAQKLMGRLAVAGLLKSARGTGGGFTLARSAAGISLADIIEAVEGPIAMTNCAEGTVRGHDRLHFGEEERAGMDARMAAQGLSGMADDGGGELGEARHPADRFPGRLLLRRAEAEADFGVARRARS